MWFLSVVDRRPPLHNVQYWAHNIRAVAASLLPVEKAVATELRTAIKRLLPAEPVSACDFECIVANYCDVARCLLPMQSYKLERDSDGATRVLVATTTYYDMFLARAGPRWAFVPLTQASDQHGAKVDPVEAVVTKAEGDGLDYVVVGDSQCLHRELALKFHKVTRGVPYQDIVSTKDPMALCGSVHLHDIGAKVQCGLGVSCFGVAVHDHVQPLAFECRFSAPGEKTHLKGGDVGGKLQLFADLHPHGDSGTWRVMLCSYRCTRTVQACSIHRCMVWYHAPQMACSTRQCTRTSTTATLVQVTLVQLCARPLTSWPRSGTSVPWSCS